MAADFFCCDISAAIRLFARCLVSLVRPCSIVFLVPVTVESVVQPGAQVFTEIRDLRLLKPWVKFYYIPLFESSIYWHYLQDRISRLSLSQAKNLFLSIQIHNLVFWLCDKHQYTFVAQWNQVKDAFDFSVVIFKRWSHREAVDCLNV